MPPPPHVVIDRALLEESMEDLYENAPCGYLSTDPDGLIVKANGTLLRWTGYSREELVTATRFTTLLTNAGKIYYDTHLTVLLRMSGCASEIALDLVCKDGQLRPVLLSAVQKKAIGGVPLLNRMTIFDATERRRYERELLVARRRAEQVAADLVNTNTELRRAHGDLEQFAYSASHDLKEPLRMVSIYAELLKHRCQHKLDPEEREFLKFAVDGAHRVQALLDDLLAYAQAAHITEESVNPVAANEALNQALAALEGAICEAGATIETGSLPALRVQNVHLVQLFQNLISNALKYRDETQPTIRVNSRRDGENWILSVEETASVSNRSTRSRRSGCSNVCILPASTLEPALVWPFAVRLSSDTAVEFGSNRLVGAKDVFFPSHFLAFNNQVTVETERPLVSSNTPCPSCYKHHRSRCVRQRSPLTLTMRT